MDATQALTSLGIAAGLGLLVGLQRERAHKPLAGFRSFALISVLGAVCALMAEAYGGWIVAAGLLAVTAALVIGNVIALRKPEDLGTGITTEVAAILMFAVGAYAVAGPPTVVVALGVGVAILLQEKERLHGLAAKLGDRDMRAILQFAAITFIILPLVPDESYGPYDALNPYHVWLMVVLVVGISLGAYVAYKVLGPRAGTLAGGLLGGAISSTATTVSYARGARGAGRAAEKAAAVVILLAGAIVYIRLLVEIAVVAPKFWSAAVGPLTAMLAASVIAAGAAWFAGFGDARELPERTNPTELRSALVFAGIYAVVLLAVAAANQELGGLGTYAVAAVSGLTDMDAITLSSSRLAARGQMEEGTAWRAIVIASLSNIVFKFGVVWGLGGPALGRRVAPYFGISVGAGVLVVALWPG